MHQINGSYTNKCNLSGKSRFFAISCLSQSAPNLQIFVTVACTVLLVLVQTIQIAFSMTIFVCKLYKVPFNDTFPTQRKIDFSI